MINEVEIVGYKPISVWNRPLGVNFKDIFKSLGKAIIHGITNQWVSAAKELVDATAAIYLKEKTVEEFAWLLIYRSLNQAMISLIYDSRDLFILTQNSENDEKLDVLLGQLNLEKELEQRELGINRNFFSYPKQLAILEFLQPILTKWLKNFVEQPIQAEIIAYRLPTYFVFALNQEWRKNRQQYELVEQELTTPFTQAKEKEFQWFLYRSWLQKKVEEPMFSEVFGLNRVYIPLRAYYWRKKKNNQFIEDDLETISQHSRKEEKEKKEPVVINLEEELTSWLNQEDPYDAIRIISGGPGSGKSSFVKIFAAHLAANQPNLRILFISLHLFDLKNDLVEAIQDFIQDHELLNSNPLTSEELKEQKLLIIFDGLDELASQGTIAQEVARKFLAEVQRKTERFNRNSLRLQVLISGRELIIQDNSSEFRKEKQILHLLPYLVTKNEKETKKFVDDHDLLKEDQRQQWWLKYSKVTGNSFTGLPNNLDQGNLIEITAQPLLNYLVALSYLGGRIEFNKNSSLNVIYDDLLKAVYQRGWEKRQNPRFRLIQNIEEKDFIRILEEIGLASWHGDGRTTTVKEINEHCGTNRLKSLFNKFQGGAEQGITRLLMAFYFRQNEAFREQNKTFEFTHKSFGEYLTARRIVQGVKLINKKLKDKEDDLDEGWDEREALVYWAKICGPTRIDRYLLFFIQHEINLQQKTNITEWQKTLCSLIAFMLRYGMPMEDTSLGLKNFFNMNKQAINAEEALLVLLSSCASVTQEISQINWLSQQAFGTWISRFQGQSTGRENPVAFDCLNYLLLSNSILYFRDFYQANLEGANLVRANLVRANLEGANLKGAHLEGANLEGAHLEGAHLEGANLEGAYLEGAHLTGAYLEGAYLKGANFIRAYLKGANLKGANLKGAYLEGAYLEGANLLRANLLRANLKGAYLEGANLKGANLVRAYLVRTNLVRANLEGAYLVKANLKGANLVRANLVRAYLEGVNLEGANLEGANLEGANFIRANLIRAKLVRAKLVRANLEGAYLYQTKFLDIKELKSANNWEKAIYTKAKWDYDNYQWFPVDKEANEAKIQEIKDSNGMVQF
ncbi:MAG: pentapeptide repeat-containing protein [Crocosphaera sp.]|nr:pentapeptide repeat-containing protein [Crocosphaera sp.]